MRRAPSAAPAGVLALLLAVAALAAPLPSLRRLPPHATPGTALAPAFTEGERSGLCAARLESVTELLAQHLARTLDTPLPTPNSRDAGPIAVLEDDGTFFYADQARHRLFDLAQVGRAFYQTHGDDYDALAIYSASGFSPWLGSPTSIASAFPVRNTIQGIGLSNFDLGAEFGSVSRLENLLVLNSMDRYPVNPHDIVGDTFTSLDVIGHEFGHRWLAYVWLDSLGHTVPALLGRDYQHWNFFFDSDSSLMEGCDWVPVTADSFLTDGVSNAYGIVDQYLMGLRSKAEIDSFFVVNAPANENPPGIYVPYSDPFVGFACRGRATWWKIVNIETANGPRMPDAVAAPHAFRIAFVLVVPHGSSAATGDLSKLEGIRSNFPGYFNVLTSGRGTAVTTLDSRAGRVCILHTPLKDSENASSPHLIGARVLIAQAGIPITLDASSVKALWRLGSGGAFTAIPMSAAGPDSFAGSLPALPSGGTVEYYLHASSDSAGIETSDPEGGAAAPHRFTVGPDLAPPQIMHHAVRTQGSSHMPQTLLAQVTDNLGVDSVWVEYTVDCGTLRSAAVSPAGRDSFAVSLGAGLAPGQRLAYRFVARDRAAARNLGYSNAAWDTLVVGHDLLDDFENGSSWAHWNAIWSFRDAWHLSQESSLPSGGTAWKCGAWTSEPYPPHLDSNLLVPYIYDVVPGTLLRFEHRFGLEEADSTHAWDGARLEIQSQVPNGPWLPIATASGYTHTMLSSESPLGQGTPCWSGNSGGWRSEVVDLSSFGSGPLRVRFRMTSDDLFGDLGWFVDHVRVNYPQGTPTGVPGGGAAFALGLPHPNPARNLLCLTLVARSPGNGEWSLYDLAGRRVATLWRGALGAGGSEISARLPGTLNTGLYFARFALEGRAIASQRVAVLK